jgi:branched-chain amino acid transport system substrate-binding protein
VKEQLERPVDRRDACGPRRSRRFRRRGQLAVTAVCCLAALSLAACGSSSSSNSSSSSSGGGASSAPSSGGASGSPIDVTIIGPFTSAGTLNFGNQLQTAEAAVKAINASGGIKGHPLSLSNCDDQFLPNKAVSCYQAAAQNSSIVAEIGGYQLNGDSVKTIVDAGKLPVLGDTAGSEANLTDPNWFNATASQNNQYFGAGAYAASFGGKTVGVIDENLPTTHFLYDAIGQGFKSGGGQNQVQVGITQATVDLSSPVSKLLSLHPDSIVMAITSLQTASAIQLLRQSGFKGPIVIQTDLNDAATLKKLFSYGNVYGVDVQPSAFQASVPGVASFQAAIKKYEPSTTIDGEALTTWGAFQVFKDVASKIQGPVTRASLTKALNSTSTLDTQGLTPNVPGWFTKPGPVPTAPRIVNTDMTRLTYSGGTLKWNGKWYPGH